MVAERFWGALSQQKHPAGVGVQLIHNVDRPRNDNARAVDSGGPGAPKRTPG